MFASLRCTRTFQSVCQKACLRYELVCSMTWVRLPPCAIGARLGLGFRSRGTTLKRHRPFQVMRERFIKHKKRRCLAVEAEYAACRHFLPLTASAYHALPESRYRVIPSIAKSLALSALQVMRSSLQPPDKHKRRRTNYLPFWRIT